MVYLNLPNLGVKDSMHKQTNEGMNVWKSEYLCPQDINMAMGACACRRVCGCAGEVMGGLGESMKKLVHG